MQETSITGYVYPPNSSNRKPARLNIYSGISFELVVDGAVVKTGSLRDLKFSDRVGSITVSYTHLTLPTIYSV